MRMSRIFFVTSLAVSLLPSVAAAQESPAASEKTAARPADDQQTPPPPRPEARKSKVETPGQDDPTPRLLGFIPIFSTTARMDAPPLSSGQKFNLFARESLSPVTFSYSALEAGAGQAANTFPEYGQGARGYGKRFGANFADSISSNFFSDFLYPSIFREDPRYFRLGEGGTRHRVGYALAQEFVCHTDSGGRSFNWANLLGAFSSGALSNTYYPESDRTVGQTMGRSGLSLLYGSAGGLVSEFWPDIQRKMFHRKRKHDAGNP